MTEMLVDTQKVAEDSVAIAGKNLEKSIEKLRGDLTRWVLTVGILETAVISIIVTLAIALTR